MPGSETKIWRTEKVIREYREAFQDYYGFAYPGSIECAVGEVGNVITVSWPRDLMEKTFSVKALEVLRDRLWDKLERKQG